MAQVLGLGGVFIKSANAQGLSAWYRDVLGIAMKAHGKMAYCDQPFPDIGFSAFSIFPADTQYFAPSDSSFMINLIVDDVDAMVAKVEAAGGMRAGDPADEDGMGRFGWVLDPDGNKIEFWAPAKTA